MNYSDEFRIWTNEETKNLMERKLKIAVFGQANVGKTSLIKALIGDDPFSSFPLDPSLKIEERGYDYRGTIMADIPWYSSNVSQLREWINKFHVDEYDIYVFVFSGELSDADMQLIRQLKSEANKACYPFFFVRNKADAIWDDGLEVIESREKIKKEMCEAFDVGQNSFFFASCRTQDGIADIKGAIFGNMSQLSVQVLRTNLERRISHDLENRNRKVSEIMYKYVSTMILPPIIKECCDYFALEKLASEIRDIFELNETENMALAEQLNGELAKSVKLYGTKDEIRNFIIEQLRFKIPPITFCILAPGSLPRPVIFGNFYKELCYNLVKTVFETKLKNFRRK